MSSIPLNIETFRSTFPAYSDETIYTDQMLDARYSIAKFYLEDSDDCIPESDGREFALQSMLAHLLYIADQQKLGNMSRVITSAGEKSVTVSLQAPSSTTGSDYSYWLQVSPYGSDVAAMLSMQSAGGIYISNGCGFPLLDGGY